MFGNKKNNKKYGYQQQQKQKQINAHTMELVIDTFHNTLEALEEYIGKAGYYSDWGSKRQIYRKSIADSNDTVEGFEDLFLTQLFIVKASVNKKPEFFRKEVQKEFKKWISVVGIDVNNCPEKLKGYLFTINEVLEGRGEEFVNQTRELIKDVKLTPQDSLKFFSELQEPLNKNDERGSLLKGKDWNQVENERKLSGGNLEEGEKVLEQISKTTFSNQINFYNSGYYQSSAGNPQQITNSEIILDIKQNPRNWRIDEIITKYDNQGRATKKELALIHNSAEISFDGAVSDAQQPVYLAQRFNQGETTEIKGLLNISQTPNYDNWTKEQFIAEIERLKAENEWLRNNQTLTDSEKQERIQQNQQQLQSLQVHGFGSLDNSNSNSNSNSLPSLFIGGTILSLIGLVSFLVIKTAKKNRKKVQ